MIVPNVLRKVKVDGSWKLLPVWKEAERLDWSRVNLNGQPLAASSGTFYVEYREAGRGSKRIRRAVGTHPRDAKAAMTSQSSVLHLRKAGVEVDDAPQIQSYRPIAGERISAIVADFMAHPPLKFRRRSLAKYGNALTCFAEWTRKTHTSQLDRTDINGFMAHIVNAQGRDPSTAIDKAVIVQAVMNEHGAQIKMNRGDWPKVTERQPEVYEPAVLQHLFAAATPHEFALFQTFLMTGFRDQEIGFLSWDDFNPRNNTLTVSKKVSLGFDPKTYQERTIPVPDELVTILCAHRATQCADEYLIFPTSRDNAAQGRPGGQRDRHMLDMLKRLALRAASNCGRCRATLRKRTVCCDSAPVCQKFGLHRFRHTYATTLLRDGVDLVSLQKLLGHKDMDSTRKYLRALEPADLLSKIKSTSIATRFLSTEGTNR